MEFTITVVLSLLDYDIVSQSLSVNGVLTFGLFVCIERLTENFRELESYTHTPKRKSIISSVVI